MTSILFLMLVDVHASNISQRHSFHPYSATSGWSSGRNRAPLLASSSAINSDHVCVLVFGAENEVFIIGCMMTRLHVG